MRFYLLGQRHTLASALREALDRVADAEEDDAPFASCTLVHPLDDHLEVECPSPAFLRTALLSLKEELASLRP